MRDGRLDVRPTGSRISTREDDRPAAEYVAELRDAARPRAVELRLQSEVPLGAFLSGGIDSTIIVGLMPQLAGRAGADVLHRLSGAGVRRDALRPRRRPSGSARCTRSSRCGPTRWRSCRGWSGTTTSRLPTVRPCPRGTSRKLTRQHVTVALTGDGGDELFAGYPRYQAVWLADGFDRLPGWLRRLLGRPLWQRLPAGTRQKSIAAAVEAVLPRCSASRRRGAIWNGSPIFGEARRAALYSDDFLAALAGCRSAGVSRAGVGPLRVAATR